MLSFVVNASTYPRPSRLPSLISYPLSTLGSEASPLTHVVPPHPLSPLSGRLPSISFLLGRTAVIGIHTRTLKRGGPWSLFALCLAPDNPTIIINATVLTDCSCSPVDSQYSRAQWTLLDASLGTRVSDNRFIGRVFRSCTLCVCASIAT